ncbi:hypothetical protein [Actinosynnema sp. NPDC020468]|uniref:hypothetical protein n=1 Tax=Actinosynnema sp. NPDC020468 TaxID=3154488 RepID=UPI0033DEFE84
MGESTSATPLVNELRALRLDKGEPSYRVIAAEANRSPSTISDVFAGRVDTWPVLQDVVAALGGDVERFRKLYELDRSERLGLTDRAEQLGAELELPEPKTVRQHATTLNFHDAGTIYVQNGGPPPYSPLAGTAPADLVALYDSACASHAAGAHLASLSLVATLVEAVVAREGGHPAHGLGELEHRGLITRRTAELGRLVVARATEVVRGERPAHPLDSTRALSFALALLATVHLDREGR